MCPNIFLSFVSVLFFYIFIYQKQPPHISDHLLPFTDRGKGPQPGGAASGDSLPRPATEADGVPEVAGAERPVPEVGGVWAPGGEHAHAVHHHGAVHHPSQCQAAPVVVLVVVAVVVVMVVGIDLVGTFCVCDHISPFPYRGFPTRMV